jgi:hypothetical protein
LVAISISESRGECFYISLLRNTAYLYMLHALTIS